MYLDVQYPYPGMYPGMRYEGMYPVPSANGYALHTVLPIPFTLGPGYGEIYTHKTLKQNYK